MSFRTAPDVVVDDMGDIVRFGERGIIYMKVGVGG